MHQKIIANIKNILYKNFKHFCANLGPKYFKPGFHAYRKTKDGVFVPSSIEEHYDLAQALPLNDYQLIIDFGHGLASSLVPYALKDLPGLGIESDQSLFNKSKLYIQQIQNIFPKMAKIELIKQSLYKFSFKKFSSPILVFYYFNHDDNFIYYLSNRLKAEAPKNSLFIYLGPHHYLIHKIIPYAKELNSLRKKMWLYYFFRIK
ncbi:MAG: hypothetical protein KKA19_05075 [Candidatus Margulisbacteria bacterium]|nr:hypothetical protein [Candidatus Margulisiibacteriota bacterium]